MVLRLPKSSALRLALVLVPALDSARAFISLFGWNPFSEAPPPLPARDFVEATDASHTIRRRASTPVPPLVERLVDRPSDFPPLEYLALNTSRTVSSTPRDAPVQPTKPPRTPAGQFPFDPFHFDEDPFFREANENARRLLGAFGVDLPHPKPDEDQPNPPTPSPQPEVVTEVGTTGFAIEGGGTRSLYLGVAVERGQVLQDRLYIVLHLTSCICPQPHHLTLCRIDVCSTCTR